MNRTTMNRVVNRIRRDRKRDTIDYQLPDGRIVSVSWEISRGASWLAYQLSDGRVVDAIICAGQR